MSDEALAEVLAHQRQLLASLDTDPHGRAERGRRGGSRMTKDARYLAALQAEHLKRVAERSFPAFVHQAWPILEPTTAFLPNWHIDLVCEYLEAVTAGEIRRLVINLPPRYGKSLLVTILWPVWEWIRHPATRWVFTSYAESLAGQHSQDRRTLLQSPWYCGHWGSRVSRS